MNPTAGETPPPETPTPAQTPKKWRRLIGRIARFFLLVVVGFVAGFTGLIVAGYFYFARDLPSIEKLKNYCPPIVTQVYSANGELIGEFYKERRYAVPIDQIPQTLKDAFISAEGRRPLLRERRGSQGIQRDLTFGLVDRCCRMIYSGPLTWQVARTSLPSRESMNRRKMQEAILANRIERSLGKEYILFLYLNQVYLGNSAYGVEAAAKTYFDKSVQDLTIAECAILAGLPKGPSIYSPRRNPERALERRNYVLERMLEDGKISEDQYRAALEEQPKISDKANPYPIVAQEILKHVGRYVQEKYGMDALYKEGLQVYTTAVRQNNGDSVPPVYVKKIVDRHGKVLEENDAPVPPR